MELEGGFFGSGGQAFAVKTTSPSKFPGWGRAAFEEVDMGGAQTLDLRRWDVSRVRGLSQGFQTPPPTAMLKATGAREPLQGAKSDI